MGIIYVKNRGVFGIKRNITLGGYVEYRALNWGRGVKICGQEEIIDLSDYISDPYRWKESEINAILMIMPEFKKKDLEAAANFATYLV